MQAKEESEKNRDSVSKSNILSHDVAPGAAEEVRTTVQDAATTDPVASTPSSRPESKVAADVMPLGFMMAISKAQYFGNSGTLEVTGWSLGNEKDSEFLLTVPGADVLKKITPGTELRMDVAEKWPQYEDLYSGWRIKIDVPDMPEKAAAVVSYASHSTIKTTHKAISHVATAAPADIKFSLSLDKCEYSPLRSLCTLEGKLSAGIAPESLTIVSSSGRPVTVQGARVQDTQSSGLLRFTLQSQVAGIVDGETFRVVSDGWNLSSSALKASVKDDSARRSTALMPSVAAKAATLHDEIEIAEILRLKFPQDASETSVKNPGEVCYFPPFKNHADLSNHFHRASWYLTGEGTSARRITFFHKDGLGAVGALPEHFTTTHLVTDGLNVVTSMKHYLQALQTAEMVLVWRPISKPLLKYLSDTLADPQILTVATEDPSAVEYGNYCQVLWLLTPREERKAILAQSHARFREVMVRQRAMGKTSSAVLGTGPSVDRAFDFDFSRTMTVACNTIVASDALLDHVTPAFVTAGDAVSHFGVSRYAEKFRDDLVRCLTTRDVYFLTSANMGYVLVQKHPEIRDRVLLCEQRHNGINTDLADVWALPRFDSTLNIHMLPIAASFSDTIFLLGLDGKNPDPAANEDFWAHSSVAHYHELVESGHVCHPSFAVNRAQLTADRFLASTEESFSAAECLGKSFYALAHSFTPAVHARPASPQVLKMRARSKVMSLSAPTKMAGNGKRALIMMSMPRQHFSGGRIHATLMAEAMALFCDDVVVWTSNAPPWMSDLAACPAHSKVRYWVNDFLEPPEGHFDYVVVVPNGGTKIGGYHEALEIARRCDARTVFLNFESPNWFNVLSPEPRQLSEYAGWFAAACFSDVILSSAETAIPFARDFYRTMFHQPEFAAAPPAINSPVANIVLRDKVSRERQVVVISRFGDLSRHKNIEAIFDIFPPEMQGYTVALVAGTSDLPNQATIDGLTARMEGLGMKLKILHMISDRRKFEEIAKSELMVFPSLFEGFGYPPVEAGYMNTPCVAYDLPVLREFNDDHAHFVPPGDVGAMRDMIAELLRLAPTDRFPATAPAVRRMATVEAFAERLRNILEQDVATRAARNYSVAKFDMALAVYRDGCHEPKFAYGRLGAAELRALVERYAEYSRVIEDALARMRVLA